MIKNTLLLLLLILVSCQDNYVFRQPIITIQPFNGISNTFIQTAKIAIDSIYDAEIKVLSPIDLPQSAYYAPRNRYRADSLIRFLRKIKPKEANKIIGLTTVDISTTKDSYEDYGIMGLGFRPGESCVVSTFRIKKGAKNTKQVQQRFRKVVCHELGHNFGLKHCIANGKCMMQSAKGKSSNIDKYNWEFCESCKRKISKVLRD